MPAPSEMDGIVIDRGFVRLDAGLVHYRTAGKAALNGALPLYMAHSGPGSSLGLVPLIAALCKTRYVLAPDMLGNGDSEAPRLDQTDLRFYVDAVIETFDKLGIDRADFYGQHTGALIGCELALAHPDRVGRLIFDGISLFPPELKAQMIEHYAPRIEPDDFGGHLVWAWSFVRDLFLHFPYFLRDPEHRLNLSSVPNPAMLQPLVVDLIKALPSYHLAYQAAFAHATAERLALLHQSGSHPTLIMAVDGDPLAVYLDEAAALMPDAQKKLVRRDQRIETIKSFLEA